MRKELSFDTIERWLRDEDCDVRKAAMNACRGRDVPLEVIERWLRDGDWWGRKAAMNACQGRDVPLEVIERGLRDEDCDVREAAMNACQGRDVPLEVIERWLRDEDWRVREAAMNACQERGGAPVVRTFEPPATVYKKCLANVIVAAKIPGDAQVRGTPGGKCRASKAIIAEVIGNICGEPVGVSIWDKKTTYYVGDEVFIEDFDFSNKECSAGFHFFCTLEEAMNYSG